MSNSLPPHLLVAVPKGFAFARLFEQKIDTLTKGWDDATISIAQDPHGWGKDYFSRRGFMVQDVSMPTRKTGIKSFLSGYSHLIVFWDGDEFVDLVYVALLLKKPLRTIPVQITKVRNKDKDEDFDVYIGRGTPWGNPYPIGKNGVGDSREVVIEKFKHYFFTDIVRNDEKRKALLSLSGLKLGCHCKPLACHGDIIAAFLNSYEAADHANGNRPYEVDTEAHSTTSPITESEQKRDGITTRN